MSTPPYPASSRSPVQLGFWVAWYMFFVFVLHRCADGTYPDSTCFFLFRGYLNVVVNYFFLSALLVQCTLPSPEFPWGLCYSTGSWRTKQQKLASCVGRSNQNITYLDGFQIMFFFCSFVILSRGNLKKPFQYLVEFSFSWDVPRDQLYSTERTLQLPLLSYLYRWGSYRHTQGAMSQSPSVFAGASSDVKVFGPAGNTPSCPWLAVLCDLVPLTSESLQR